MRLSLTENALSEKPRLVEFDLRRVMRTKYVIDRFQEIYFVIDSFEELIDVMNENLGEIYKEIHGLPNMEAGALIDTDKVVQKGTL